ncbi:Protein SHQ1 like protein [Chelonia mydas]|uniref:Protein SHQ1 homolog n=1 Tax=Chelonia mydas TaxID=8469 RepID=M7AVW0_CHEMY|nr:Protein SHQ1 like protein [Chelonia mydas]
MITPAFELSQDPDFLTIIINVPYAKVSEFDVYFEGKDFKFYAKPYFLRQVMLTLPGRIVEDGREKASYNVDKGIFTVRLPKETPGQYFDGLDMLTALLAQKKSRSAKPLVEEIGTSAELAEEEEEEEEEEFDWEIEQTPYHEIAESTLHLQCCYGFGNLKSGVFQRLQDELSDVIDVKDPDLTPADGRRQKRLETEAAKFDPDHYLADFFEDEVIQHVLKYKPWWVDAYAKKMASQGRCHQEHVSQTTFVSWSEEEKEQLRKFTNKSYLLDKRTRHQVYFSLIDILLAYCYEICITEGDKNVVVPPLPSHADDFKTFQDRRKRQADSLQILLGEVRKSKHSLVGTLNISPHGKIAIISETLHPGSAEAPIISGTETRAPAKKTMLHTEKRSGKSAVLKCLLDIHKIFRENDPAYILNDLYITDYCIWIQKTNILLKSSFDSILENCESIQMSHPSSENSATAWFLKDPLPLKCRRRSEQVKDPTPKSRRRPGESKGPDAKVQPKDRSATRPGAPLGE